LQKLTFGERIAEQEADTMIGKYGFLKTYCGDLGEFTYLLTARKARRPVEGRG
jgi:hypothetical protein